MTTNVNDVWESWEFENEEKMNAAQISAGRIVIEGDTPRWCYTDIKNGKIGLFLNSNKVVMTVFFITCINIMVIISLRNQLATISKELKKRR